MHSTGPGGGLAPIRERLTETELAGLVARLRELALRYEISVSSVKQILGRAK